MADDKTGNDELETQDGAPLPPREMMSLLNTGPAGSLAGIGAVDPAQTSPVPIDQSAATSQTPHVPVGSGDEMHTQDADAASSEPRSETISQSDSASSQT
jgi:hypothetical protein